MHSSDILSREGGWGAELSGSQNRGLAALRGGVDVSGGAHAVSPSDGWIERIPGALVDTSKDGFVVRCNRAALQLVGDGLRPDAHLCDSMLEPSDVVDRALDLATDEPSRVTLRAGERRLLASVSTSHQGDEAVVRWLLIDETDWLDDAPSQLPAVLYTCEADDFWTCRAVTQRVEALTGVSRSAWLRHPHLWLELVAREDQPHLLSERWRVKEQGGTLSCEYRIMRRDGRVQWVHDQATVDDDGRAHGLLIDVSHRHRLDGVLHRLHEAAQEEVERLRARQARSETFFRTAVHDLRGALTGMSALVRDGSDLDELGDELRRARDLATGILEFEGLDDPAMTQAVDVGHLLLSVVDQFAPRNRRVTVDADGVVARIEPAVASRVVSNLVGNAFRHTPEGTPIRVRAAVTRQDLVLSVEDDGPGIDARQVESMFRPGQRREDSSGLGLGLSLARELTELSGGRLWHEELPAGGTSFQVSFPQ